MSVFDYRDPFHQRLIPRVRDVPVEEPTDETRRLVADAHASYPNLDGPRVRANLLREKGIDIPVGQVNACLIELGASP